MPNINTDVWGDTWTNNDYFTANTVPDTDKFYGGQTMHELEEGGAVAFGTPIDPSICYAAHGAGMPLSSIKFFAWDWGADSRTEIDQTTPTGWFFCSNEKTSTTINYLAAYTSIGQGMSPEKWSLAYFAPDGVDATGSYYNDDYYTKPIIKFNPHTCILAIQVLMLNQTTGVMTKRWLDDLQQGTAHTDEVIVAARGVIYTVKSDGTALHTSNSRAGVGIVNPYKLNGNGVYKYAITTRVMFDSNGKKIIHLSTPPKIKSKNLVKTVYHTDVLLSIK